MPDNAEVHLGLWNYDNSVGMDGESFVVGKGCTGAAADSFKGILGTYETSDSRFELELALDLALESLHA